MNIFYLDTNPTTCARYHNDKHVVKMILEYAQLLSTAHRVLDGTNTIRQSKTGRKQTWYFLNDYRDDLLYNATHINHPSAKWCRDSASNYEWLYELFCATCDEYTFRYGKIHLTDQKLRKILSQTPKNISSKKFEAPWRAMPDEVKIGDDSLASYRNYYNLNKTHLASWKGKVNSRTQPEWFTPQLAYK